MLNQPQPPISTLFPYTTLFRSVVCQFGVMFLPDKPKAFAEARRVLRPGGVFLFNVWDRNEDRSEEHTSELQSHVNLVCRLLLEKKNNKIYMNINKQYAPFI